jgi:hypothetical protein
MVPDHADRMTAHPPFPPIADYGFLSDCEVTALVANSGNVEWLCTAIAGPGTRRSPCGGLHALGFHWEANDFFWSTSAACSRSITKPMPLTPPRY